MQRTLTLSIDPEVFKRFPSLRLGGFVAEQLTSPMTIVALVRALAQRHLVPISGYDVDALPDGAITLRGTRPRSDWFMPLGARPTEVPLSEQLLVHAAGTTILNLAFDRRESRQTCLCAGTRRAAFVTDAITKGQAEAAATALEELRRVLVARGARVGDAVFVDASVPGADLRYARTAVGS